MLRLFGNAKHHGWTGTANRGERDRLLVRNNWRPQTTYYVSTKNSLVLITCQRAALGTILAYGSDSQIARGALLSFFALGALLSWSSPLALGSSGTDGSLAAAKHDCYGYKS